RAPGPAPAADRGRCAGGARRAGALHPYRAERDLPPVPPPAEPRPGDVRVPAPGGHRPGSGARLQHGLPALPARAVRDAGRARGGLLMAWSLPWSRKPDADAVDAADDAWTRHVTALAVQGVAEPGSALGRGRRRPATQADHDALYGVAPSFAD